MCPVALWPVARVPRWASLGARKDAGSASRTCRGSARTQGPTGKARAARPCWARPGQPRSNPGVPGANRMRRVPLQVELLKEVFQLFDTEDKGYFTKDDLFL